MSDEYEDGYIDGYDVGYWIGFNDAKRGRKPKKKQEDRQYNEISLFNAIMDFVMPPLKQKKNDEK